MKKDKFKIYILELLLIVVLFFALFLSNIFTKINLALFLLIYMIGVVLCLKKRNIHSIYHKQIIILMTAFAAIYLIGFYLMGIYFGFYEATLKLSFWSLVNFIIPIAVIIVTSEVIRSIFLAQKNKSSKWLTFISMVLIDLIIYTNIYAITSFDGFLTIIGFILFASISCNLLYNYISTRFGCKSIIIYRLITVLYVYLIPIIPDLYVFFRSFLRMIYPYIIYLVLENTYSKSNFAVAYKDKRKSIVNTTSLIVITTLIIMLISCQFKYGILVIGSGSMTGAINKGDAIVYESYDGDKIYEGDVLIFERSGSSVVHRVVDIKNVNGEYRYFTKGDANQHNDSGYVVEKDIIGVTKFRIIYIGYPTLWLRDIFS